MLHVRNEEAGGSNPLSSTIFHEKGHAQGKIVLTVEPNNGT